MRAPMEGGTALTRDQVISALKGSIIRVMRALPVDTGKAMVTEISYTEELHVLKGHVDRVVERTWLGVPGLSWEVRERGADGYRSLYTLWLGKAVGQPTEWELGTVTVRTVRGNVSRGTFEEVVPNGPVELPTLTEVAQLLSQLEAGRG